MKRKINKYKQIERLLRKGKTVYIEATPTNKFHKKRYRILKAGCDPKFKMPHWLEYGYCCWFRDNRSVNNVMNLMIQYDKFWFGKLKITKVSTRKFWK